MTTVQSAVEGSRYSPPVSPRTVSTQASPDSAIQGDHYFLDEASSNADNKYQASPRQRQGSRDESKRRTNWLSSRQRPPPLQVTTNSKPEAKKNRPTNQRSQVISPGNTKPLSAVSLDLRPLQELLNERSYLLYNLQKQDERATTLFRRYATLEAQLAEAHTAKEARKIRKEAKLLKHKITESTQQEQLIFLRLGEIYIETQNRERWMQFRYQQSTDFPRPAYFPPLFYGNGELALPIGVGVSNHPPHPPTPYLAAQPSPAFSYSSASALSPFSPDFVPGVAFSEDIWGRPGLSPRPSGAGLNKSPLHRHSHQSGEPRTSSTREMPIPEEAEEENETHDQDQDQDQQETWQHGQRTNSIVPWHEPRHHIEGTTATSNENIDITKEEPQSTNTTAQNTPTSSTLPTDVTMTDDSPAAGWFPNDNDEESRLFKSYIRAVSVNSDVSPSSIPLSPHNCYNWAVGMGSGGGGSPGVGRKRMSLPSLRMVWPRGEQQEGEQQEKV